MTDGRWSGFARTPGGAVVMQRLGDTVQFYIEPTILIPRVTALMHRWMMRAGLIVERLQKQFILVDTGWARAHIRSEVAVNGLSVKAGILEATTDREGRTMRYPMMQEQGIRRHFVSFVDRAGNVRDGLIHWAERHGIRVWRVEGTSKPQRRMKGGIRLLELGVTSHLARRGLMVWGYAAPWMEPSWLAAQPTLEAEWQALGGTL